MLFAFGSADLTADATTRLAAAAAAARGSGNTATIDGYTDGVSDPTANLALSELRATAVLDALRPRPPGVAFTVRGHGEDDPVAATNPDGSDSPGGRAANRRVTVTVTR